MKYLIYTLVLFLLISCTARAQKVIAITYDDLPCSYCTSPPDAVEVHDKLLRSLDLFSVSATGFINEHKLYNSSGLDSVMTAQLVRWIVAGHELGNHTYSHISINSASVQEYEQDILRGEEVTRPLLKKYGKKLQYFRHTQLRTGPTPLYQQQLDSILLHLQYTSVPVTIDNDEYIFAFCYSALMKKGEKSSAQKVALEYLEYMKKIVKHYEQISEETEGRQVKHILLLHANELNADYSDQLYSLLQQEGYSFISAEQALTDTVYSKPMGFTVSGLSVLNRREIALGKKPSPQPPVPELIMSLFRTLR